MQYLPAIASAGSSITCGIYTVAIPAGSSSSTSDDISLTASFDASVTQSLYSLHMTLTAVAAVSASALTFSNPFPTAQCAGGYDTPGEDTYAQTVFFQPLQSASPGTYNIVFTVTDGTDTATATVQLTIAATSDATIPPAITNGQYSAWVYPNALTVAPSSTISAQAGVYYQTLPPLPLTASWSGLPEGVLVSPAPEVTYNDYEFTLWTSDNTTDGTYTVTFTLTWTAVDDEPAPANESWTASFSFTLVIDSSYVASTAKYKPPVSGRSYGIVGGASRSGYTLRALAMPVNPRTVKQVAARHKFSSAKLAWLSYGPFGANNPVTEGYTPQEAWLAQNLTYNGVLSTGPSVDGVVGEGTLGPCASAEAYEVMVNVNRANLGLNALDTPTLVDMALSMATYPVTNTEGAMTLALNPQAETGVQTPGLIVVAGWSSSPLSTAPTALSASGATLTATVTAPQHIYDTLVVLPPTAATATASDETITYTIPTWEIVGSVVGALVTATGWAPALYNVTSAPIISNTTDSITVATAVTPFETTATGTVSVVSVISDYWQSDIYLTASAETTAGDITVTFNWTDANGSWSQTFTAIAAATDPAVAFPCPTFILPIGMTVKNVLAADYSVTGFSVAIQWASHSSGSNQIPDGTVAYVFCIIASDQYTASSGAPNSADWKVLMYTTDQDFIPANIFAAWKAIYGDLGTTGYIKFQAYTIHPDSGASGPAISKTASWEAGTTKGIDFTDSLCPYFKTYTGAYGITGKQGTTISTVTDGSGATRPLTVFESWTNGNNGPATYTATLPYDSTTASYPALPSWMTVTYGTPTETAPTGWPQEPDTWYVPLSITLASDATVGQTYIEITGVVTAQTFRYKVPVVVTAS